METPARVKDWFIGAIEAQGNVHHCLQVVMEELEKKLQFVGALQRALHQSPGDRTDHLSQLGQQVRLLAQTIQVRLGLLAPDREITWFRKSVVQTGGPFASHIYADPVFFPYETGRVDQIAKALTEAYAARERIKLLEWDRPGNGTPSEESCLWTRLLDISAMLETSCQVNTDFLSLRLDKIPDDFFPTLESRPLRAFLLNVQSEVVALRGQVDQTYERLLEASQELWKYQRQKVRVKHSKPQGTKERGPFSASPPPPPETIKLSNSERASLRFMGFDAYPDPQGLRRRYLELARKLHPDVIDGKDEEFKVLLESYQCLQKKMTTS